MDAFGLSHRTHSRQVRQIEVESGLINGLQHGGISFIIETTETSVNSQFLNDVNCIDTSYFSSTYMR